MKTLQKVKAMFLHSLMAAAVLVLVSCGDDVASVTATLNISGTVTYPNMNGTDVSASGAVVYLVMDTDVASTNYDYSTIASATGSYAFANLEPGDYYVFSTYNTENTNLPSGRFESINFDSGDGYLITLIKENVTQNVAMEAIISGGTDVVNTSDAGTHEVDINHSVVAFEFPFDAVNATFSGDFKTYDMEIIFDEANPTTSSITVEVDLSSVFTGQPGRDDKGGCLGGTLGIVYNAADTLADGSVDPAAIPTGTTGTATFTSSSIAAYGDGYLAKGNMTFNGTIAPASIFFQYFEGYDKGDVAPFEHLSSFEGIMEFDAFGDFGIDSSHILDGMVTVTVSAQIKPI